MANVTQEGFVRSSWRIYTNATTVSLKYKFYVLGLLFFVSFYYYFLLSEILQIVLLILFMFFGI